MASDADGVKFSKDLTKLLWECEQAGCKIRPSGAFKVRLKEVNTDPAGSPVDRGGTKRN
jgi:hypothetical protein